MNSELNITSVTHKSELNTMTDRARLRFLKLYRKRTGRGLLAIVAMKEGVSLSLVSRVAKGSAVSSRIRKALAREARKVA